MRRPGIIFAAVIVLSAVLMIESCVGKNSASSGGGKLLVYSSFYAMYDLTKKIGGERIDLVNLVPAGTEPHANGNHPRAILSTLKKPMFLSITARAWRAGWTR